MPRGNGFGGGVIYYPTDTSQGTFGAIAISPGLNGTWPGIAWLGPRLASQGFVVFGIETNNLNDSPTSRGTQLLAALDYLTQSSSVRNRVDASRLAVAGHSMGGGGALDAALRRPSLQGRDRERAVSAIGKPVQRPGSDPHLRHAERHPGDPVPPDQHVQHHSGQRPRRAYIELAGAGHNYIGQPSTTLARTWIPWLKIFVDNDARYSQFLCPLTNRSGISQYRNSCPLISTTPPTSSPSAGPTTASPTGPASTPPVAGACSATYRTVNSWSGGYQGEVTVRAGSSAINGWTVTLDHGQRPDDQPDLGRHADHERRGGHGSQRGLERFAGGRRVDHVRFHRERHSLTYVRHLHQRLGRPWAVAVRVGGPWSSGGSEPVPDHSASAAQNIGAQTADSGLLEMLLALFRAMSPNDCSPPGCISKFHDAFPKT